MVTSHIEAEIDSGFWGISARSNIAFERTNGSPPLAVAAQREPLVVDGSLSAE